ncbi:MAG TPA: prolyl oligopeptidase family serine peptidase [Bryobacteraceae bacterium]|nr:prolyl oligopeptidase family serine peptidase [Bryobacteraceae bacterium]
MRRAVLCAAVPAAVAVALCGEAVVPLPSNLKAEGIPPIPVALMEKLNRYSEARSAFLLDWHPVRREVLISTRFGEAPQIHRVAMPGGARTQLTFFPDRVAGGSYDPQSGEAIVFAKDVGGAEFFQFFRQDLQTGAMALLTDGKSRNTGLVWSRSGRRIAYASTRRNGKDTDIYVADPRDPASTRRLLEVEGGGWSAVDFSPDERRLVVSEYRSISDTSLYLVDEAGRKELLTPAGEKAAYHGGYFDREGKGIYLITDRDSEFLRLAWMDLGSRKIEILRADLNRDVDEIAVSRDGRRLAYTVNEEGVSKLYVMDTSTRKEVRLPAVPAGVIGGLRWHNNGRELGFTLSSARSPADVYSIDVETGKLERWTFSETGGLNPESFSEPELIRWKSFDGRMISGFLYQPPAKFARPRPVIIKIHGGPEAQYRPGFLGADNYFLNELGVAIIQPNVRGSAGYGKTFLALDNGMKREDAVKDIGALLDWIGSRPDLDKERVMVTGGSYGGYMTLAVMTHYNDRVRCALDVVGISNFVTFLERTEAYRRDLRRAEYGDERDPKMREFLLRISPLTNAHKIRRPMFIVQGKNDPRVPASESEQMVAAIRNNGVPVWYLLAEDEGHGFAKKKNRDVQLAATVLFVEQHLLK